MDESASYFQSVFVDEENDSLKPFSVTQFDIKGSGDNETIVLIGSRLLDNAKVLELSTPEIRFTDTYEFMDELQIAIETAKGEVLEFLAGKRAPDLQMELELPETSDEDSDIEISFNTGEGEVKSVKTTSGKLKSLSKSLKSESSKKGKLKVA